MFYCAYHLCHCDPIMRAFGKNKVNVGMCIGVRAPLDLGGGGGRAVTLLPEKNYTMPESMCYTNAIKSQ